VPAGGGGRRRLTAEGAPAPARAPRPVAALAVLGVGASVAPLDFAVNVAFPAIAQAFALPTHAIRWVAVCYVLVTAALMVGFGALGDRIGHLRVFRWGLWLAVAAFVLCAIAPAYPWLLGARALQGVAVAALLSCAPALATRLVDEAERTWALGAFASMSAVATLIAPYAGGLAMAALGWPGVYWLRVPLALAALAGLPWLARALRPAPRRDAPFDARGAALLAAAIAAWLLAPALLGPGAGVWPAVALAAAGALLTAAFVRGQRRSPAPVLPRDAGLGAAFARLNTGACVVQFACFAVPLILPFLLLRAWGWTPPAAGAVLTAWALGGLAGAWLAPRTVAAWGAAHACLVGLAAAAAGLAGFAAIAAWPAAVPLAALIAVQLLHGAGHGLWQVAYADRVVAALPASVRGAAGSLSIVTRNVGVVVGATLWTGMLQWHEAAAIAAGTDPRSTLPAAVSAVYAAAAAIVAPFAVAALLGARGRTA